MRKPWIVAAILAGVLVVGVAIIRHAGDVPASSGVKKQGLAESPPALPETAIFDLHYRGLTGWDDTLIYRHFRGTLSGPRDSNDAFVKAVSQRARKFFVMGGIEAKAPWVVVEVNDTVALALYCDLNADGGLSDDERILPMAPSPTLSGPVRIFVTPDFMLHRENGQEIPFRAMLFTEGTGYGMWAPCCVLEGQTELAGKAVRLYLYSDGFSGSFTTLRRSSFILAPADQSLKANSPHDALSSLICHNGLFYHVGFDGAYEKGKILRMILRKDTAPTGQVAIDVKGREPLRIHPCDVIIRGAKDDSIEIRTQGIQTSLPMGEYKLSSGDIQYGVAGDNEWKVHFDSGPNFAIAERDEVTNMEFASPALVVHAVEVLEEGGCSQEKTVYARGAPIDLFPRITGKAGEVYVQFSRKDGAKDQWTDVTPHVSIFDPAGNEVASEDMEYG